jgi:hypothetical protein
VRAIEIKSNDGGFVISKDPKDWNGVERLAAITPALGAVIDLRERLATNPGDARRIRSDIAAAIDSAASRAGVSPEHIERWIDTFTYLGKPGLLAPVKLTAQACAAKLQGTWELKSRLTNGRPTVARSHLYYDMDAASGRGQHLMIICTDEPDIRRDSTLLVAAFSELTFRQNGEFEVVVRSRGQLTGNHTPFETGREIQDEFRLVRHGHEERMIGMPGSRPGATAFNHRLVQLGGDPNSLVFAHSGLASNGDMARTQDVVDTYVKVSSARPLVGGWQPIREYFDGMVNPTPLLKQLQQAGLSGTGLHLFQKATGSAALAAYAQPAPNRADRVKTA